MVDEEEAGRSCDDVDDSATLFGPNNWSNTIGTGPIEEFLKAVKLGKELCHQ